MRHHSTRVSGCPEKTQVRSILLLALIGEGAVVKHTKPVKEDR